MAKAIRATVSAATAFIHLPTCRPAPGLSLWMATGYQQVGLPALEVLATKATRHDVVMNGPDGAPGPVAAPAPAAAAVAHTSLGTRGLAGA